MPWLKQVLIALLNFAGTLAAKCMSLNNEPHMIRPILMGLNPIEVNYYQFMIKLDKYNESCNVVDDLSTKNACFKQNKKT